MILHPGILALLLGGVISFALLSSGVLLGIKIARHWQPERADALQLELERRSWLVTTLVQWAVAFEACSLILFIYTADRLNPLFVGAMCATGTLNANPVGWHLLWIKLGLFLVGSLWLIANSLDRQVPSAPLTKVKFFALWVLLPLCAADLTVMTLYFAGLQPEIITSCCGTLFSASGHGVASELAALPTRLTITVFYMVSLSFASLLLACRWIAGRWLRTLLSLASCGFGVTALVSIVTFISVYYYRLPQHHCPFDLLQSRYYFVGYPLYFCLFGAILSGLVPQFLGFLRSYPALSGQLTAAEHRWLNAGLILLTGFLILVSWPLLFGSFTLKAYL